MDDSEKNSGGYHELTPEEQIVLSVVLPRVAGADRKEVNELVAKELGASIRDSAVVRISDNIIRFLGLST
jgi:hypothetical protein